MNFLKKSLLVSTSLLWGVHGVWAMDDLREERGSPPQATKKEEVITLTLDEPPVTRSSSSHSFLTTQISGRIQKLRELCEEQGIDGFVIPHNDEYQSEDLPEPNKRLEWLTGFTGSAGLAVVTGDKAVIFVDSRYTTHAKKQVPSIISVEESNYLDWLKNNMRGKKIGYDSRLYLYKDYDLKELGAFITFKETPENLIDRIWGKERPSFSAGSIDLYPEKFAGEPAQSKIKKVRKKLEEGNIDAAMILDLDSIAWLLNIRGHDLPYTPVILSSLLLPREGNISFITTKRKLTSELQDYFSSLGVVILHEPNLDTLKGKRVLVDKNKVSVWLVNLLTKAGTEIIHGQDPSWLFRAKKNPTEIENMRLAHICDGVALCEFLAWLDKTVDKETLTEKGAAEKLLELRKHTSKSFRGFRGENFFTTECCSTISAFGPHAEMAHYSVKEIEGEGTTITGNSLFLIDSGAQYRNGGTTDITRTIAVGTPTDEHKDRFTRVLKGHIALANVIFPRELKTILQRTPGVQLDSLPRQFLWEGGLNYGHGTSHGVGSYLAVHESPGSYFGNNLVPLEEGMVLSNEPGYYKEGAYGIRIENLMLVVPSLQTDFLGFETISLAPIDKRLIEVRMLTDKELLWLNNYHDIVFRSLSPYVDIKSLTYPWLTAATSLIDRDYEEGMSLVRREQKNRDDIKKGLKLIHKSAENGHLGAQERLAALYLFGFGEFLPPNKGAAFKWQSYLTQKGNADPEP